MYLRGRIAVVMTVVTASVDVHSTVFKGLCTWTDEDAFALAVGRHTRLRSRPHLGGTVGGGAGGTEQVRIILAGLVLGRLRQHLSLFPPPEFQ